MGDRAVLAVVVAPALLLAAGALLRSVPGEWSQSALLAWAAVSLGFLAGRTADTLGVAVMAPILGFFALALGGAVGLIALSAVYAGVAVATVAGVLAVPWPVAALLASACAAGAARSLIH